ncbi:hypothetical protein PLESTM_000483200 [Pleodorina starrii]|nr:hypothetical protein PLESTM_000483200 [Pleodorina starrii]
MFGRIETVDQGALVQAVLASAVLPLEGGGLPGPVFGGKPLVLCQAQQGGGASGVPTVDWSCHLVFRIHSNGESSARVLGVPMRVSSDMQLLGVCADVPAEILYLLSPVSSLYPCLTVAEVERLKDITAAELKELGDALLLVGVIISTRQNHPRVVSVPVPIAGLPFSPPPSVHEVPGSFPSVGPAMAPCGLLPLPRPWRQSLGGLHESWLRALGRTLGLVDGPRRVGEQDRAVLDAARRRMEEARSRQTEVQHMAEREAARRGMEEARSRQTEVQRTAEREAARRGMEEARSRQTEVQRTAEREAARRGMEEARSRQTEVQRTAEREAARRGMEEARSRQTEVQRTAEREAARRRMEEARSRQTEVQRTAEREAARRGMEEARRRQIEARLTGRPADSRHLSVLEAVQQRLGVPYDNVANIMLPEAGGLAREVAFAQELDRCVRHEMPMWLCAVCSCIHGRGEVQWVPWDDIPNVQLLRTDIPSTAAVPRDAKVVYRRPLQPDMVAAPPPPPAAVYGARDTRER